MNTASTLRLTDRELRRYKRYLQHKKIMRRRVAISILSILLILLFVFSFSSISQAGENIPETTYKYFTYHTVDKGDTLWSMAEEHIDYSFYDSIQDYVSEVKEINHLTDDTILIGQTIVIPYFSDKFH